MSETSEWFRVIRGLRGRNTMAKKAAKKKAASRRRTCTIEDRKGDGPHVDVLRFAEARKAEHGTTPNAICVAVRQSCNFRAWQDEQREAATGIRERKAAR